MLDFHHFAAPGEKTCFLGVWYHMMRITLKGCSFLVSISVYPEIFVCLDMHDSCLQGEGREFCVDMPVYIHAFLFAGYDN